MKKLLLQKTPIQHAFRIKNDKEKVYRSIYGQIFWFCKFVKMTSKLYISNLTVKHNQLHFLSVYKVYKFIFYLVGFYLHFLIF